MENRERGRQRQREEEKKTKKEKRKTSQVMPDTDSFQQRESTYPGRNAALIF